MLLLQASAASAAAGPLALPGLAGCWFVCLVAVLVVEGVVRPVFCLQTNCQLSFGISDFRYYSKMTSPASSEAAGGFVMKWTKVNFPSARE